MSKKVTYTEIAEALAQKSGKSKQKSDEFIKTLIELVKDDLKENGSSSITNFGSFSVKEVSEREGVNPQTGEPITIPAHKRVNFSPYKALKETVNAPFNHLEPEIIEEEEKESAAEETPVIPPKPPAQSVSREEEKSGSGLVYLAILVLLLLAVLAGWFFMDDLFPGASNEDTQVAENPNQTEETMEPADPAGEEPPVAVENESSAEAGTPDEQEGASENTTGTETGEPETMAGISTAEGGYQPVYRPTNDDWYWDIADQMYGQPEFWPLIFAANKTTDSDPDIVFAWRPLDIPEMENMEDPTAADYARLADATRTVAEAYSNHNKPEKAAEYNRYAERYEELAGEDG